MPKSSTFVLEDYFEKIRGNKYALLTLGHYNNKDNITISFSHDYKKFIKNILSTDSVKDISFTDKDLKYEYDPNKKIGIITHKDCDYCDRYIRYTIFGIDTDAMEYYERAVKREIKRRFDEWCEEGRRIEENRHINE